MASYLVLRPHRAEALDDTLFVRDGLNWLGLLLPPLYLVTHRLWLALAVTFAALMAAAALGELTGPDWLLLLVWGLAGLYVGLEGAELRVHKLAREQWQLVDVVVADRLDDAEAIHFANQASEQATPLRPATSGWNKPAANPSASRLSGPALGMVDPYGSR